MKYMQKNSARVSTRFGQQYDIVAVAGTVHAAARPKNFYCEVSAQRFITKELDCTSSFWRHFLISNNLYDALPTQNNIYSHVTRQVMRGRIKIYDLPHVQRRTKCRDLKGNTYNFNKDSNEQPGKRLRHIPVNSYAEAAALIQSMAPNNPQLFWKTVLQENDLLHTQSNPGHANKDFAAVATQLIADKKLKVFQHPFEHRHPLQEFEEAPENQTKPVEAAPSQVWIEVKLLDPKNKPISNEEYVLKDNSGKEFKGVTDSSGMLRLTDIIEGNCELSFPRIDELAQPA